MIDQGYLLGDRYKIIDTLGEGGMANVYLADDIILQRKVAVKILRLDLQKDSQTVHRFQREAIATSELSHPNIVSVFDVDNDHGIPYMVMAYIDGPDLKTYIREYKPLALTEVIRIMDQILSAMALAHQHNVIHRDLKPQNILMDQHHHIKIADFGIAVALDQNAMTQTNSAMGSVHYMSPEQARGGVVTKQSDIYSLGIILYELITGEVPFGGETAVSIALKHIQETVPSIRKQNIKISQPLENVVYKATAKDPRDRYTSVMAMKQDLDTSLNPGRANEPIFKALHDPQSDETIVLPAFNGQVTSSQSGSSDLKSDSAPKEDKIPFWQNLKKHKWWWLGSVLAILLIMVILISAFSQRNDVSVPDMSNMTTVQAKTALKTAGLKVGAISREHSASVRRGRIIKTLPAAGATIQNGKSVALVISNGRGLVKVPDVAGESYQQAHRTLKAKGFAVARQTSYSDDVESGDVISQDVVAGTKVNAKETTITLMVSMGPKPKKTTLKLRDLTGYSQKSANDYAQDNGLTLQITEQYSNEVEKGNVISQDPGPGETVNRGDTVHLVISKGQEPKDDNTSSSSSSSSTTVTHNFTVPYDASESNDSQGNHVQIYISDDHHTIGDIYRDMYIKKDQNFSIPFSLTQGDGHLRVVRDGQVILDESGDHG